MESTEPQDLYLNIIIGKLQNGGPSFYTVWYPAIPIFETLFLDVFGIYTLLGDSITENAIEFDEMSPIKFVVQVEQLYGLKCWVFNVHCLTHLAKCVKN